MVTYALVTSRLEYYNVLYLGLLLNTTQKFQLIKEHSNAHNVDSHHTALCATCTGSQFFPDTFQGVGYHF